MKIKIDTFILTVLGILFLLPHLPSFSYGITRFMDFFHLLSLIFITAWLSEKNNIKHQFAANNSIIILLIFLYVASIISGNFSSAVSGSFSPKDLTDLYRPVLWITSIFIGVYLSYYGMDKVFKLIQVISICSFFIALFQKLGIDILYKIYSGGNHIISNRTTGIAQDFADYSLIQMTGACIFFHYYRTTGKVKNILMGFLLSFSVLLSTSKAGIALMLGIIIFFFASILLRKNISSFYRLLLLIFIIICVFGGYKFISTNEKFGTEVYLLLMFDENLPSINERQNDYNFVINKIFEQGISLNTFIGFGGTSNIADSYIEVAWLTILYRTGIIGLIIYYSLFLFMLFQFLKKKSFEYFAILLMCAIFIDIFAAMTNRLLGMNLLFIIYGLSINRKTQTNNINFKISHII
jgi:hypothetical protein